MLCLRAQEIYNVTVLLLGVDNAGKTTFLANLLREPPSYVVPTIGYRRVSFKYKRAQITFIDLGGGQSIRTIWRNYYALAHAAIFIVDVSDLERLEKSREVLSEMTQHPLMQDKPILVFGNKQDMLQPGSTNDIERLLGLREDSCPSQRTDTNSVDTLNTAEHNLDNRSDVIHINNRVEINQNILEQGTVHLSTPDVHCNNIPSHCSLVERGLIRFRYCSAINQGKEMRHKVILKSISWLLRAIRSNWSTLESRVCSESSEQLEREKRERRERAERVRAIKEQRDREEGTTEKRPNSENSSQNPFLPIARAVEMAEKRENTDNANPIKASLEEEPAPPDSEEAAAVIAQYFEDASKRISHQQDGSRHRTILDSGESIYVNHVSSDPGISASRFNQDELRIQSPLQTIHEGPSHSFFHKKRRRNRITPMSPSPDQLGPLRSSPGSPPSSLFQTFQKSQRQMDTEVYPLMPSNPWCRPFTPDSGEKEEQIQIHQVLNSIQESNSLPDIAENLD